MGWLSIPGAIASRALQKDRYLRYGVGATLGVQEATREVQQATVEVQQATKSVQVEVQRMATETGRIQRLAIWVGVAAVILGALLGGIAGAFAAKVIGS